MIDKNKKIIFMGTPVFAKEALESLIKSGYNVISVVTQPDKKVGRKKEVVFSEVKKTAISNNISVLQPKHIMQDFQNIIDQKPDIIITAAYGQIIPDEILNSPKYGCINIHGSLLPKYRGGAPIHHAIINGEIETGITLMYMDSKMDSGDIIKTAKTPITQNDTYDSLYDKMKKIGANLLIEELPNIFENKNDRIKQNEKQVTFGFNIKREDELIDFNKQTIDVYNHIRGLNSKPGAYALLGDKILKIYDVVIYPFDIEVLPGQIKIESKKMLVGTLDGSVEIKTLKLEGKKMTNAKEFIFGAGKKILSENEFLNN